MNYKLSRKAEEDLEEIWVYSLEIWSKEQADDTLILLDKIERAEKESERGETITEAELEKEIEKWFN